MATRRSKMAASSFLPCALPLPAGQAGPAPHARTHARPARATPGPAWDPPHPLRRPRDRGGAVLPPLRAVPVEPAAGPPAATGAEKPEGGGGGSGPRRTAEGIKASGRGQPRPPLAVGRAPLPQLRKRFRPLMSPRRPRGRVATKVEAASTGGFSGSEAARGVDLVTKDSGNGPVSREKAGKANATSLRSR